MKSRKVRGYLIATILTLSASSFLVSYFIIDDIIDNTISIGVNTKNNQILLDYQQDLKKLKNLDAKNQATYKEHFYNVQEAMIVYQKSTQLVSIIKKSYMDYFLIIFTVILVISIFAATFINRKVANSYAKLLKSDLGKSKRLHDLEYFDNWQQIASNLAHEIKNPLTPIEMMMTNLKNCYNEGDHQAFEKKLDSTQKIVLEEVERLKNMVSHFTDFSKLPEAQLTKIDFVKFINNTSEKFKSGWNNIRVDIVLPKQHRDLYLNIDTQLFYQCLLNLLKNAVEANEKSEIIEITLKIEVVTNKKIAFYFTNRGVSISDQQSSNLFHVGFSSKSQLGNQGFGLPLVKKIILEHYGEIKNVTNDNGVTFKITLPLASKNGH